MKVEALQEVRKNPARLSTSPREMISLAPTLALAAVTPPRLAFIGPLAPRNALRSGTGERPPEGPKGRGLDEEELQSLLSGREALVLAADDLSMGVAVAEGLADVGARVTLASNRPRAAARASEAITRRCERRRSAGSCEARHVDLSDEASVWEFAEGRVREARPLHVLVNCADDVEPFYHTSACGWERTAGANHLGPFLMTQLLLDQMVGTMRRDAAESARLAALAAKQQRRRRPVPAAASSSSSSGAEGDGRLPPAVELRPSPAPLARIVTVGRVAAHRPSRAAPATATATPSTPAAGLALARANFSSWRAYRASHEANLLGGLQLHKLLQGVPVDGADGGGGGGGGGDTVAVNVVHPGGGRWLPAAARRLLGLHRGPALSAVFLASSPLPGLGGLYFESFASQPPWSKTSLALSSAPQRQLAMQRSYEASRALAGAPLGEWFEDLAALVRAERAQARRAQAAIRSRTDGDAGGPRRAVRAPEGFEKK